MSKSNRRMDPTPGRTALIVIDMQNAFCRDDGSFAKLGFDVSMLKAAIAPCERLIAAAHTANVPVIFTRLSYAADYHDGGIAIQYMTPEFVEARCLAAGTWDIDIVDELKPAASDHIIDKNRFSAFYAGPFERLLETLGIDTLVVCGVTTNGREHRQRHILPYEYDPTVNEGDWAWEAPLLARLLIGAFLDDADQDAKIELMGEVFGAAILGNVTHLAQPKAFVFHGPTANNGKSQILDCLRGLLPKDAVQSISPADFDNDPKIALLAGAMLNATDELGGQHAVASDRFKSIITGDMLSPRKPYAIEPLSFRPRALHVFATNELVAFHGGLDRGVQRRLMPVAFNRVIPKEERIPHLGNRIVAEEGAQLLAFAVHGAVRLVRQGRFTEPQSSRDVLNAWVRQNDPVAAWMSDCVEVVAGKTIPIEDAYESLRRHALREGRQASYLPAINQFAERVYRRDGRIKQGPRQRRGTERVRTFEGLKLLERS